MSDNQPMGGLRRAATGAFAGALTLVAAFSIGAGQAVMAREAGDFGPGDHVRQFTWTGGDELAFSVPADVRYTQGPAAPIVVSGPSRLLERLELRRGELRFDRRNVRTRRNERLEVTVTLPAVRSFSLAGSQRLTIAGYNQPDMALSIAGSGKVTAAGATRAAKVSIAGSGDIDLSKVALAETKIRISGSGSVTAGPTEAADVSISGSGDVRLLNRGARVSSSVSGSGSVRTVDR